MGNRLGVWHARHSSGQELLEHKQRGMMSDNVLSVIYRWRRPWRRGLRPTLYSMLGGFKNKQKSHQHSFFLLLQVEAAMKNWATAYVYGMLGTDVATVGTMDMWLYRWEKQLDSANHLAFCSALRLEHDGQARGGRRHSGDVAAQV